jgi:hypothetical protein
LSLSVTVSAPTHRGRDGANPERCLHERARRAEGDRASWFQFVGSFVTNTNYPNGTVFKTSPPAGVASLGSEVTAFVATGPAPSGHAFINPCLLILQTINPGLLQLQVSPTPTPR